MSDKIVASLFESAERASATADRLEAAGIDRNDISLVSDAAPHRYWASSASADYAAPIHPGAPVLPVVPVAGRAAPVLGIPGADVRDEPTSAEADRAAAEGLGHLAEWLAHEGVDEDDAGAFTEGVRRGGALLAVKCGEADVDRVVSIIDSEGIIDFDQHGAAWQAKGWTDRSSLRADHGGEALGTCKEEPITPAGQEGWNASRQRLGHGRVRVHSRTAA